MQSRREFRKKSAYVAPLILSVGVRPTFATGAYREHCAWKKKSKYKQDPDKKYDREKKYEKKNGDGEHHSHWGHFNRQRYEKK